MSTIREPTFLILTALAAGSLHGYGVMREVTALSNGEVNLRASTLYAALDRLTEDGLIVVDREEAVDGRLRRYYVLTSEGVAALEAEAVRMRRHATAAVQRLRAGQANVRQSRIGPATA
ncbi:MAG TPA: PadR family transcriptional regulator [Actinoplanes sp.]|nr:PadR family transcriptional regulator [Actinoplanes sp.]